MDHLENHTLPRLWIFSVYLGNDREPDQLIIFVPSSSNFSSLGATNFFLNARRFVGLSNCDDDNDDDDDVGNRQIVLPSNNDGD